MLLENSNRVIYNEAETTFPGAVVPCFSTAPPGRVFLWEKQSLIPKDIEDRKLKFIFVVPNIAIEQIQRYAIGVSFIFANLTKVTIAI